MLRLMNQMNICLQPFPGLDSDKMLKILLCENGAVFDKRAAIAPGKGSVPGVGASALNQNLGVRI
jgi:hypothetical protein